MLQIRCPWCGDRAQIEYRYAGDAARERPDGLESGDFDAWYEHVYLRANPRGPHEEYWQHVGGCRQHVKVLRDTATHEILATASPGEAFTAPRAVEAERSSSSSGNNTLAPESDQ
ncbi:MAG: heterotetrameric sarcosine oxidase delta subunit [Gammaproteobacteria bacterium]|jgi:heterotetrameric sarcosine oxidase delta subunit